MLRALYDWTMDLAASRHAASALAAVSFVESSVFPIPPDTLLIPMVLADRAKAWWYASLCTLTSVIGGLAGYAIGFFLFEAVAEPLLGFYSYAEKFEQFAKIFNDWGAWAVLVAGVTPFPFKVITIFSGFTKLSLPIFIVVSLIARAIRFFAVAGLLYVYGPPIRTFIEKRLGLVFTIALGLLIGGFIIAKYAL